MSNCKYRIMFFLVMFLIELCYADGIFYWNTLLMNTNESWFSSVTRGNSNNYVAVGNKNYNFAKKQGQIWVYSFDSYGKNYGRKRMMLLMNGTPVLLNP